METMSNDECTEWMRFNISANDYSFSLPFGINEQMLCTKGILDEESGIYSVRILQIVIFRETQLVHCRVRVQEIVEVHCTLMGRLMTHQAS